MIVPTASTTARGEKRAEGESCVPAAAGRPPDHEGSRHEEPGMEPFDGVLHVRVDEDREERRELVPGVEPQQGFERAAVRPIAQQDRNRERGGEGRVRDCEVSPAKPDSQGHQQGGHREQEHGERPRTGEYQADHQTRRPRPPM